MQQFIELLKMQGQQGQLGHFHSSPAVARVTAECASANRSGAAQGHWGQQCTSTQGEPPTAPALPPRLSLLRGTPKPSNGAASSQIAPSAHAAPIKFDKSETLLPDRSDAGAPRWPHVWHFTVDGKRVTAIDHERRTLEQMQRDLYAKYGAGRVSKLELRGA